MITVVALGKSKFGSIRGYINPFWASFFYFLRFFLSFLQFFILESCYIWFKLSLEYPSEYVYSFALVKFKIWVYLGVCKPCFEPYCPFSEIFFYFFNFSLKSFWVRNAVCFRISTRAVGPYSLRLVDIIKHLSPEEVNTPCYHRTVKQLLNCSFRCLWTFCSNNKT